MQIVLGLLGMAIMVGLIAGYIRLQYVAVVRWDGLTGGLALLPLPVWILWFVMLWRDLARDPTSHNLFPFEMLFLALGSGLYLLVLMSIRHVLQR